MRGEFLKSKAIFMAIIIVSVIFTVYNVELVSAEEETNYCCEQTVSGESCQYGSQSECDPEYSSAAVTCDQTSFCEGGCCIADNGKCSKNVPKAVCENTEGYSWSDGEACDVPACEKNCCTIADSICSYTTSANCEYINSDYPEIEVEFVDVDSELACVDICTASNKGCCVTEDGCTYDTKEMCESADINLEEGTGFYDNRYCSDLNLCGCVEHFETKCVDEDVYWFDSCGNQEEVAEDCDYTRGSWCGEDEKGDAYCKDTDCDSSFNGVYEIPGVSLRNVHDATLGEAKEHGESWCLYESPAGGYLDRPGSQHYRSFCYFGEQIIEPCRDYREEICLQNPLGGDEGERGSACLDNEIYDTSLINSNVSTVPTGSKFWSETSETSVCAERSLSCDVVFVKRDRSAQRWKCVENCECLSELWMVNSSNWCMAGGDCGAQYNILEEFSSDSFSISRSQDLFEAGDEEKETIVAYDWECDEAYQGEVNWLDEDEVYGETQKLCPRDGTKGACSEYNPNGVKGIDEELCIFYDSMEKANWYTGYGDSEVYGFNEVESRESYYIDERESQTLKNSYGIHGGLQGLSEYLVDIVDEGIGEDYLADYKKQHNTASYIVGGTGLAILLAAYVVGAATTAGFVTAGATITGVTFTSTVSAGFVTIAGSSATAGPVGWVVAVALIVIAVITYIFTSGGETVTVTIASTCEPWQAPVGGDFCELCDIPISEGGLAMDDGEGNILSGYECTEYKCRSLGAACEFIEDNAGSERDKCFNAHVNDVNHPVISLNKDIFDLYEYDYEEHGDWVEVFDIAPYTQFKFGLTTDELAQCKIDTNLPESYEEMDQMFPNSYYDTSKNQTRVLTNGESVDYYVRCQDYAGNYNIDAYVFKVHALEGEDVQAPIIEATDIASGAYVAADIDPVVTLYTNEPAQCKWSQNDQEYDLMENWMLCSGELASQTVYFDFSCTAQLNVSELGDNQFYFLCQDYAENTNTDSYEYVLKGTEPLVIDRTSPNGTLYYNDVALQVYTSVGAEQGKSVCYYDGIEFFTTESSYHEQLFTGLGQGNYGYDIVCQDVGGNQNSTTISFTVDVDEVAAQFTEIYVRDSSIYFTLDESASCEYHYEEFTYGEGTSTSGVISVTDLTTYYITCVDEYSNEGTYVVKL